MSVSKIKIEAEITSNKSFSLGDNPIISSFMPAEKRIINDAAIESKIVTSWVSNISEPKKALIKNAPNEIPKPPRCGVFFLCELLSLGLAVRFLITLI